MVEDGIGSSLVPVFPLSDVVFFPHTVLPLHIFEPRYRSMVRDAMSGDRRIAMALLRPGWERDYEGSPAIFDIGTVGRIEDLQSLPDGRFNLQLVGLQRVRFHEVACDTPYRVARFDPLDEPDVDEDDPRVRMVKIDLLASHGCLLREISGVLQQSVVLDESIGFVTAVNQCCANLPVDPEVRQSLLEEHDLIDRARQVTQLSHSVLEHVLRLKARISGDLYQPN